MKIKCACGCGIEREQIDKKGRERFYVLGHHFRGKSRNVWNAGKKNIYSKETLNKMSIAKKGKCDNTQEENEMRAKSRQKSRYVRKNSNCEICNSQNNLTKHHWRYDKPLMVNTLCKECHDIQHIKHFDQSCFGRY